VSLLLTTRQSGDIPIVACRGRIVEGTESEALRQHLDKEVAQQTQLLLDLRDVDFIDSSGLGLLVRLAMRLQSEGGELKLCHASAKIKTTLKITKLITVLKAYDSEADAIAAFAVRPQRPKSVARKAGVLCVTGSADLLAYLGQVIRQAGYAVTMTDNLADAETMLAATRPKLLVIDSDMSAAVTSDASLRARFNTLIDGVPILELPSTFSRSDAAETSRQLIERVRGAIS
jgi:anti-sigma B factor antagonist